MSVNLRAIGRRWARPSGRERPPRWLFLVPIAAIAVGAWLAVGLLPSDLAGFEWWPIAVMAALTVPAVALNGYEYLVTARLSGVKVGLLAAVRIAIYGTAANLLPLPGASLVRIEAMRRSGVSLRRGTTVTAAVGLAWLAISLIAEVMTWVPLPVLVRLPAHGRVVSGDPIGTPRPRSS